MPFIDPLLSSLLGCGFCGFAALARCSAASVVAAVRACFADQLWLDHFAAAEARPRRNRETGIREVREDRFRDQCRIFGLILALVIMVLGAMLNTATWSIQEV